MGKQFIASCIQEQLITASEILFRHEYRDMLTGAFPNRTDYQNYWLMRNLVSSLI
jgi:hypothetical protein